MMMREMRYSRERPNILCGDLKQLQRENEDKIILGSPLSEPPPATDVVTPLPTVDVEYFVLY